MEVEVSLVHENLTDFWIESDRAAITLVNFGG